MSDIDESTGRLSPPHLQMLWNSSEHVGPGDVRDLIAEVRRLRPVHDAAQEVVAASRLRTPVTEAAASETIRNWRRMSAGMARLSTAIDALTTARGEGRET